jgi:hypothetical protein
MMTAEEALEFVRTQGVVLLAGKGPAPRMVEVIAGEPIKGSWWGHPKSHDIFRVVETITASPEVLVCCVVGGKVSLVHRRLWPALIRASLRFPAADLVKTSQEHTAAGRHVRRGTPFPDWADAESLHQAETLTEEAALEALGAWTQDLRRSLTA